MRWVFFLLLLANAIAGYWFYGEAQQRTSSARQPEQVLDLSGQVPKLVLLKEVPEVLLVDDETESEHIIAEAVDIETVITGQTEEDSTGQEIVTAPEPELERCSIIGPFVDGAVAADIGGRLAEINMEAKVIQREILVREDYWLIILPLDSEKNAASLLKKLKIDKIDSFLIHHGEFSNGISLGIFGNRNNAESYRKKLLEMNYHPIIHVLPRMARQYWLEVPAVGVEQLSDEFWGDIRQLSGSSNMGTELVECGEHF